MASSSSSAIQQYEPQLVTTPTNASSASLQQIINNPVLCSLTPPILPGRRLTQSDHEDNLVDDLDDLIRNFLHRFNGQQPYRRMFRWTIDDEPNLNYSVVVTISRPEDL